MAGTRGRRIRAALVVTLLVAGLAAAALVWAPRLWERYGDRVFSQEHCTVTVDGLSHTLTAQQADNAALIAAVSIQRGLPPYAAVIALATAIQESDLRNLSHGDRDSVGLFQQRPSQGWGSIEQILDRHYSAGKFYDVLTGLADWESMEVTEAAQAVQRSAFPGAYADHEPEARLWASALTGGEGRVACTLGKAPVGSEEQILARLLRDFGEDAFEDASPYEGPSTMPSAVVTSADARTHLAVVNWAVATASATHVIEVGDCPQSWRRESGAWAEWAPLSCVPHTAVLHLRP